MIWVLISRVDSLLESSWSFFSYEYPSSLASSQGNKYKQEKSSFFEYGNWWYSVVLWFVPQI